MKSVGRLTVIIWASWVAGVLEGGFGLYFFFTEVVLAWRPFSIYALCSVLFALAGSLNSVIFFAALLERKAMRAELESGVLPPGNRT